jgi:hypothetical protein
VVICIQLLFTHTHTHTHTQVWGVLSGKTASRATKRGDSQYIIMTLSDMNKGEIKMFLFGEAYRAHWSLPVGTLVFIQTPVVMPKRAANDRSTGINAKFKQQILIVG